MRIDEAPPPGWDDGLAFPTLTTAFARAARTMGQRALFVSDGADRALVLLRCFPGPLVRLWTTRARVYVDAVRAEFLPALVQALRCLGVPYARLGDSVWGLPPALGACDRMRTVTTHLMAFDATLGEGEALARMDPKSRSQLRKSEREGVRVDELRDVDGLAELDALVDETRRRMHRRHVASAVPHAFFHEVVREMVPRGDAVVLMARVRGRPLAAALFFVSPRRMSYYFGASTRD